MAVSFLTNEDKQEILNEVDQKIADNVPEVINGVDGKDGVSPTVTVSTITGGHRVTITDANGSKTFDIMDGVDGEDGVGDEERIESLENRVNVLELSAPTPSGTGVTLAQVRALNNLFKKITYIGDPSDEYEAFKTAFGIGDSGDLATEFTITNNLTLVSNNNASSIAMMGDTYSATLVGYSGYSIDSVTVLMGGNNITTDVYSNGVITIPVVTGNIEITATAKWIETEPFISPLGEETGYTSQLGLTYDGNTLVPVPFVGGLNETEKTTLLSNKTVTRVSMKFAKAGKIKMGKIDMTNYKTGVMPVLIDPVEFEVVAGINDLYAYFEMGANETLGYGSTSDTGNACYINGSYWINSPARFLTADQYQTGASTTAGFAFWAYIYTA